MKFSDLTECPFCGNDEFYTKEYWYGTIHYGERFDGEEANNSEMYDGLNYKKHTGRAYCRFCNTYLGNKETDTLSKQAEKELKRKEKANDKRTGN